MANDQIYFSQIADGPSKLNKYSIEPWADDQIIFSLPRTV